MKRELCLSPWFALSAYAFSTEVVASKDGYTILHTPEGIAQGEGVPASSASRTKEPIGPSRQEYTLWEFSQASEGRS